MKLRNILGIACAMGLAMNASAGETLGTSDLTFYFDEGDIGIAGVNLRDKDGKLSGDSSFGQGMVSLQYVKTDQGSSIKGWGPTGHVDLQCDNATWMCQGKIRSGRTSVLTLPIEGGGFKLEGNVGFHSIKGDVTPERIEMTCDGELELSQSSEGRFRGRGYLTGDFRTGFSARLSGKGTLANITDPAIALVYLAGPICQSDF